MSSPDARRALVDAARLDDRGWRRLGDLMARAGCSVDPVELRLAHPEFDVDPPGGTGGADPSDETEASPTHGTTRG